MIPLLTPAIASLSAYTTYISIRSILDVRTYEEKTEKAAKWSYSVEDQLWKTRKTEAAGLLASIVSLCISLQYTISPSMTPRIHLASSFAVALQMYVTSDYVSRFWRGKAKVPLPGTGKYNEAISLEDGLVRWFWVLAAAWVVDGFVGGWEVLVR